MSVASDSEETARIVRAAAEWLGWRLVKELGSAKLQFKVPSGVNTWGETVVITITPQEIKVASISSTGFDARNAGFEKNSKNCFDLLREVEGCFASNQNSLPAPQALPQHTKSTRGPSPGHSPPPSSPSSSRKCPSCNRLTFSVKLGKCGYCGGALPSDNQILVAPGHVSSSRCVIECKCPHCGQGIEADIAWAGLKEQCPTCGKDFLLPRQELTNAIREPGPPHRNSSDSFEKSCHPRTVTDYVGVPMVPRKAVARTSSGHRPPSFASSHIDAAPEDLGIKSFVWLGLLVVAVFGEAIAMHKELSFGFGFVLGWYFLGLVLSPIWWMLTRIWQKGPWRWYDWLNSGSYIMIILLVLSVIVKARTDSLLNG